MKSGEMGYAPLREREPPGCGMTDQRELSGAPGRAGVSPLPPIFTFSDSLLTPYDALTYLTLYQRFLIKETERVGLIVAKWPN